ncbi:MAG: undecaprenyl-diphosphate phosphatase [Euryarchaeota archaeon]|nr:undecaprenyl-diphosphate phosphatase [Euryarchaeota archaeon]
MDPIQSTLLGVLQGITEWLPISSQGQTVLVMLNFMQIEPETALSVAVFLHIGTMLAVLIRFRADFLAMLNLESKLLKVIVVATVSTGITALPLLFFVKNLFQTGEFATVLIGIMLILTGIMLGVQRRSGNSYRTLDEITTKDMVFAGLAQGFSILPGISRSGTTITILLMLGIKQDLALKLSFLMSVPAVLGAVVMFDIWKLSVIAPSDAAIMVLSSLVVGYATMSMLLRFAKRVNFAIFCVSLGGLTLLLSQIMILL